MVNIIAIDPGTKIVGIYINSGDQSISLRLTGQKKLLELYEMMTFLIDKNKIDLAIIEDYLYTSYGAGKRTMAEFVGVIKLLFERRNIPLVKMPIMTWKSYLYDKLKGIKDKKYIATACRIYDRAFKTSDEVDAFMIYSAALKIYGGETKTEAGRDVKKEIEKALKKIAALKAVEDLNSYISL